MLLNFNVLPASDPKIIALFCNILMKIYRFEIMSIKPLQGDNYDCCQIETVLNKTKVLLSANFSTGHMTVQSYLMNILRQLSHR